MVEECEEEREWVRCEERLFFPSVGVFSRPREAMSSTKDGRVVMVADRKAKGAGRRSLHEPYYN